MAPDDQRGQHDWAVVATIRNSFFAPPKTTHRIISMTVELGIEATTVLLGGLGLCYWLLRQSLTQLLNRSVAKSTDAYKAELQQATDAHKSDLEATNQRELERLRAELSRSTQHEVERLKFDLVQQNEAARHALQVELVKMQSSHGKKHEMYPELYEKLRMAEGAIAGLRGARLGSSYEGFGTEDFERLFSENRLPSELKEKLHTTLMTDRKKGVELVQRALYGAEFGRAHGLHVAANNFLILKALYATPTLVDKARTALKELWDAWVEADMGRNEARLNVGPKYSAHIEAAQAALRALESEMRGELSV